MTAESRVFDSILLVSPGRGNACPCLSFKPDIDDLRESPALHIVERSRLELRNPLWLVGPHITAPPPSLAGAASVKLADAEQVVAASESKIVLVKHGACYSLDRSHLTSKVDFDTRGTRR